MRPNGSYSRSHAVKLAQKRASGLHFLPLLSVLPSGLDPSRSSPPRLGSPLQNRFDLWGSSVQQHPPPTTTSTPPQRSRNQSLMVTGSSNRLRYSMLIVNELEQEQSSELSELIWLQTDKTRLDPHVWRGFKDFQETV